jgi:hypothetical protein
MDASHKSGKYFDKPAQLTTISGFALLNSLTK